MRFGATPLLTPLRLRREVGASLCLYGPKTSRRAIYLPNLWSTRKALRCSEMCVFSNADRSSLRWR